MDKIENMLNRLPRDPDGMPSIRITNIQNGWTFSYHDTKKIGCPLIWCCHDIGFKQALNKMCVYLDNLESK